MPTGTLAKAPYGMTRVTVASTSSPGRSSRVALAQGSSSRRLTDSEIRPRSRSTPVTTTRIGSPVLYSDVGSTPFCQVISERCTSPSAAPTSTNRPNVVTLDTRPSTISPSVRMWVAAAFRRRRSAGEHRPSVGPFGLDDGSHDAHARLDVDPLGACLPCGQDARRAPFEIDQDFVAGDRSDDPLHELPRMKWTQHPLVSHGTRE